MQTIPSRRELEEAFEESCKRKPKLESWGMFACDDGPPGPCSGGGGGSFSWFDSQKELIDFIYRFPLLAHSGDGTPDAEILALFSDVRKCLGKARESSRLDQETVDKINTLLTGIEQIRWFGQLKDLTAGQNEFAVELRESFSDEGDSGAINNAHLEEFIKFLSEWGL